MEEFFSSFNNLFENKRNAFYLAYDSLHMPAEVDRLTSISRMGGISLEYDHFFSFSPVLGLGIKGNYLWDNSSDAYNYRWEADYYSISLLGIARLPITPIRVNLHAFIGVGDFGIDFEHKGTKEKYSSSELFTTYGVGIEKYFDMFNIGFRYKFVQYNSIKVRTAEVSEPFDGFEALLGIIW
jgi:hypothetical protein